MKKNELTTEQIAHVITLRRKNKNWAEIQRITGIDRRRLQKEYLLHENEVQHDALSQARTNYTLERFRQHFEDLSRLATHIVEGLEPRQYGPIPQLFEGTLDQLLSRPVLSFDTEARNDIDGVHPFVTGSSGESVHDESSSRSKRAIKRHNVRTFSALRKHLEQLDLVTPFAQYHEVWDEWVPVALQVKKLIAELVRLRTSKLKPVKDNPKREAAATDRISRRVFEHLSRAATQLTASSTRNTLQKMISEKIKASELETSEDAVVIMILRTILDDSDTKKFIERSQAIQRSYSRLEDAWDSFVLLPRLVKTRCDECPD
jgi:hypothetical protein